jgi:hypothetical protein
MPRKILIPKIILILWVAFSILYVGWNEWTRFKVEVMQNSYNQGVGDAVAKVIDESKACKTFPVNVGDLKATLVNVDCLKQPGVPPDNSANK